jgi:hypothetical protein
MDIFEGLLFQGAQAIIVNVKLLLETIYQTICYKYLVHLSAQSTLIFDQKGVVSGQKLDLLDVLSRVNYLGGVFGHYGFKGLQLTYSLGEGWDDVLGLFGDLYYCQDIFLGVL